MEKSCGNCRFWVKSKAIKGICEKHDSGWVNSDNKSCDDWKRKGAPKINPRID